MSSPLFTIKEFIRYYFRAQNAHDLHSPFLYQLYQQVIRKRPGEKERQLLNIRKALLTNREIVHFQDPKTGEHKQGRLSSIIRKSASSHRFSCFLMNLIDHMEYGSVLETGTLVGLNTCYLAKSSASQIITIEGSPDLAKLAEQLFQEHQLGVTLIEENVMDAFESALEKHQPELVFLDADHQKATIEFYLSAIHHAPSVQCIVIHDIYWSVEMKSAWKAIVESPAYNLTIDIFQAGLIFPNYSMEKQHFSLKF